MKYPIPKKIPVKQNFFDKILDDPYDYFRDRKNSEVLQWVEKENMLTDDYFKSNTKYNLDEKINKLKNKPKSPIYSYISTVSNGCLACRENTDGTRTFVYLSPDFNESHIIGDNTLFNNTFTLYTCVPSPIDESLLYFMGQKHGADRPSIIVYSFKEKKILKVLDGIFYAAWSLNKTVLYYSYAQVIHEDNKNINYICGYDVSKDDIVEYHREEENAVYGSVVTSQDGRYIIAQICRNYEDSMIYVMDEEEGKFYCLTPNLYGSFNYIGTLKNEHLFITQVNAERGKLISINHGETYDNHKTILPEGNSLIEDGFIKNGNIVLLLMDNICSRIIRIDSSYKIDSLPLPDNFGHSMILNGSIFENQDIFINFESFTNPGEILKYDGREIISVYKRSLDTYDDIVVEQNFAPSKDGTYIPFFMIYKKGATPNGSIPTLMYGYGGYNVSMPPTFHNPFIGLDIVDWVKEDRLYIHCNLRGGNEFGSAWHNSGNMLNKKNCFYDFIGITEKIIADGWTTPHKIAISGGSNGGLLMTALVTMRPELFGCVIASVPHTDMINFKYDDRGPMYITEYGDPEENLEMFSYMLSYSPYHNVKALNYPPIYIQTGECDNNVPPYHGKKMAAKLQALNQSDAPILLRVLEKGSHDRGEGDVYWKTVGEMQTFIDISLKL